MNKAEEDALIQHQREAGLKNGEAIARIVIARFPGGFTDEVGSEVRKITDRALAHVVGRLSDAGFPERYSAPFAEGFNAGLRKQYSERAAKLGMQIDG